MSQSTEAGQGDPHTTHPTWPGMDRGVEWTEGSWQPQGFWASARWSRHLSIHQLWHPHPTLCSAPAPAPAAVEQEGTAGQIAAPASRHMQRIAGTWEWQVPQGCGYSPFLAWEGVQAAGDPLSQRGSVRGTGRTSLDWRWQAGSGTVPTMIPS